MSMQFTILVVLMHECVKSSSRLLFSSNILATWLYPWAEYPKGIYDYANGSRWSYQWLYSLYKFMIIPTCKWWTAESIEEVLPFQGFDHNLSEIQKVPVCRFTPRGQQLEIFCFFNWNKIIKLFIRPNFNNYLLSTATAKHSVKNGQTKEKKIIRIMCLPIFQIDLALIDIRHF